MATNRNDGELDELRVWRAEFAAALSQSEDCLDMATDSGAPPPLMGGLSTERVQPPVHQSARRVVTAGVTGKNGISPDEVPVEVDHEGVESAIPEQLRTDVPRALADALNEVPKHKRSRAFAAAVFGGIGNTPDASEFVSAAVELERAAIILQQALCLGLAGAMEMDVRRAIKWIERICSLRRDGISMCFRLPPEYMCVLLQLKPRVRAEFVRLAFSCARARMSLNGLVADEHLIRIACDCIVWHLEADPIVVPVAEIVPLLVVIEGLGQGGAS